MHVLVASKAYNKITTWFQRLLLLASKPIFMTLIKVVPAFAATG
jgi:hypothetical protein